MSRIFLFTVLSSSCNSFTRGSLLAEPWISAEGRATCSSMPLHCSALRRNFGFAHTFSSSICIPHSHSINVFNFVEFFIHCLCSEARELVWDSVCCILMARPHNLVIALVSQEMVARRSAVQHFLFVDSFCPYQMCVWGFAADGSPVPLAYMR